MFQKSSSDATDPGIRHDMPTMASGVGVSVSRDGIIMVVICAGAAEWVAWVA